MSDTGCQHFWISNDGLGGEPEFKLGAGGLSMCVMCSKCKVRTRLGWRQWNLIPAASKSTQTKQ